MSGGFFSSVPNLEGTYWISQSGGSIPDGSVIGGMDSGVDLYVARSEHNGALIPGKLVPSHNVVYVPWGGEEHAKGEYEVLVTHQPESLIWIATSGSDVPHNSIPGGISEQGEILYIGRASHAGTLTIGKVQPSHGVLYISYGGEEIAYPEYEILIKN